MHKILRCLPDVMSIMPDNPAHVKMDVLAVCNFTETLL